MKPKPKHKTVGVSLNPLVRQRISVRARQLGLSFSRYVSFCAEAEMEGVIRIDNRLRPADDDLLQSIVTDEKAECCAVSENVAAAGEPLANYGAREWVKEDKGSGAIPLPGDSGTTALPYRRDSVESAYPSGKEKLANGGSAQTVPSVRRRAGTAFAQLRMDALRDERLAEDVARLLGQVGIPFLRSVTQGMFNPDFLIEVPVVGQARTGGEKKAETRTKAVRRNKKGAGATAVEGKNAFAAKPDKGISPEGISQAWQIAMQAAQVRNRALRIVVECRYPVCGSDAVLLGQAVLLQQQEAVDAVLFCVPYQGVFDDALREVFLRQGIGIATPDNLLDALAERFAALLAEGRGQ